MKTAREMLEELSSEDAKLMQLTVKVTGLVKKKIENLQEQTGKGKSAIVQQALDNFFEGYSLIEEEDL